MKSMFEEFMEQLSERLNGATYVHIDEWNTIYYVKRVPFRKDPTGKSYCITMFRWCTATGICGGVRGPPSRSKWTKEILDEWVSNYKHEE